MIEIYVSAKWILLTIFSEGTRLLEKTTFFSSLQKSSDNTQTFFYLTKKPDHSGKKCNNFVCRINLAVQKWLSKIVIDNFSPFNHDILYNLLSSASRLCLSNIARTFSDCFAFFREPSCKGYSFWDRLPNLLHKFTWIVLSVHKLNKLDNFW